MWLLAIFLVNLPAVLWQDPGDVAAVDFSRPARGAAEPAPPFQFIEELNSGNSAKVLARDYQGIVWQIKGGPEARAETFVTRLVSALGYFAEATSFRAHGRIEGVPERLGRAAGFVKPDGAFSWASFERREPEARFLSDSAWAWNDNPFTGTRELSGLKILIMLVSNWDNKDATHRRLGPNTGVLEWNGKRIYFVTDWGQSLGSWATLFGRSNWNCGDYRRQSRRFVTGVRAGIVQFGYSGQQTDGFRDGITVDDVRWLNQYLSRITDAQISMGLLQAGALPAEQQCFTEAIRSRIEALRRIGETPSEIR